MMGTVSTSAIVIKHEGNAVSGNAVCRCVTSKYECSVLSVWRHLGKKARTKAKDKSEETSQPC